MLAKRLIKSNDAGGGACTNTVDLYNPFPDGGGVALYQLNGDATDVSGNYNGTASNVTYGAGQFGQAASFNTSNSVLTAPVAFSTNSPYSVSAWVKIANGSTTQSCKLFWKIVGTEQSALQVFYNGDVGSYYFSVTHKFETNAGFGYSFPANDGQWHHYAMTFNGSSANLYIDGANVASGALDPKSDVGSTNYIGGTSVYNGVTYYSGLDGVDQVRYFSRALRPYEVEALYTEEYCTPTIVPSEHFNTVTYTGDNAVSRDITSVGFQPDFTWIKSRTLSASSLLNNSVIGAENRLQSNDTRAEAFQGTNGYVSSFISNGFTIAKGSSTDPTYTGWYETNQSGEDYVAWNFKAGGAAVTNNDGTITSQVSANTEAGFSIVSYTGNLTNNGTATVGHGLDKAPSVVITKRRDGTSQWIVQHIGLPTSSDVLTLDSTSAYGNVSTQGGLSYPTSSVFSTCYVTGINVNNHNLIAYCFAEVEGFSNFGSYVGNGSQSGPYVVLGFEPAYIMIKRTDTSGYGWYIMDSARGMDGTTGKYLFANESNAEGTLGAGGLKVYENGFQITDAGAGFNGSGGKYIYMAFAADPTTIEPTLEDSFNTVLWTGSGGTESISTVGFQPDFTWIKRRSAFSHALFDSVRGANERLFSNLTAAETTYTDTLMSFDLNGFTLGGSPATNEAGQTYVAWNWKGAELPAINSNGSIPSVVSANPAAGFSIVKYKVTGSSDENKTVGHGLNSVPKVIIIKGLDYDVSWVVYTTAIDGSFDFLRLNTTQAANPLPLSLPTSSVFTNGYLTASNYIAYCFAEVAGFSKFGSYTGTGASGNTVTVGFEPAFVMIKSVNSTSSWAIFDNKRDTTNPRHKYLRANDSAAEVTTIPSILNFLSNGFEVNVTSSGFNGSGGEYIYMAFANQF